MQKPIDIRHALAASKQHVWVCMLLAILLLCNPFLVALGSAAGLNVHHRASYRATIAFRNCSGLLPRSARII
jgi:hypothetical protein